jgi:hypothetical protein
MEQILEEVRDAQLVETFPSKVQYCVDKSPQVDHILSHNNETLKFG